MDRHTAVLDREMDDNPVISGLAYQKQYQTKSTSYKGHGYSGGEAIETINNQETRVKDSGESYNHSSNSIPETEFQAHRPASRHESINKKISFIERPETSKSKSGSPRPRSSRHGAGYKLKANHASSGEEDDEVISDLLGTVRQYAQEIREIYAPMKKDEEERSRKKNGRNCRRKSKDFNKDHTVHSDKNRQSHFHLEVRAEVHKLEDSMLDNTLDRGKLNHGNLSNSRSHQTSPTNYAASLQVGEANLSSSWPKSNQMTTSLERYWSDATGTKHKSVKSSSPKFYNRSKHPADWNEVSTVQHEKEMLNRAFQRINKPYGDPLIGKFTNGMPVSQIQEQLHDSRQSVIEVARQHKQAKQSVLPSISVLAPPDFRNTSRRSSGGMLPPVPAETGSPYPSITPSAPALEGEDLQ